MKNLILAFFVLFLFGCHQNKSEFNAARKSAKQALLRIREEVKSLRSVTFNYQKKLSLDTMLVLVNGPLLMGLDDLKRPKNESITKAILIALKIELDYLKQEVALSPLKKRNLTGIQNEIKNLDALFELAYARVEKTNYAQTDLNKRWDDWIMKAIRQETPITKIYASVKHDLVLEAQNESSVKAKIYLNNINRLITSRDEYFNLFTSLVGKDVVSDEMWPRLKYSAIRSLYVGELLKQKVSGNPLSFLPPVLIQQVENGGDESKKCNIPASTGDEAGSMNGTSSGGSTPKAEGQSIKCQLKVMPVPLPLPQPA